MARPKSDDEKPLTDTELQIMNVLWAYPDGATVHDVLEALENKDYAYTTVSTLIRVLEKKGAVNSQKEGRGHRYMAAIPKQKYQRKAAEHLVDQVFDGEPTALIKNLLGQHKLSEEELKEIKALLQPHQRKSDKGTP